ncbi:MAG: Do family serine endopeptidase [Synergistaceae bacterium]|jgi:serine protease Do|nr:Do family serine endopeptidase [Synergistaceae bacterium]
MKILKKGIGTALVLILCFFVTERASFAASRSVRSDNPVVEIVKNDSPAVVNIDVETVSKSSSLPSPFRDAPFFKEFFGDDFKRFSRSVPMKGRGSGFIVSKEGQIVTNNHVVEGADKITVTLADGKVYVATVLGRDPTFDLAVISIHPDVDLPVLTLGDSDAVEVGEWVVAIGNPFGLEHTVTVGVISAKNRSLHTREVNFDGFLQTDAAINPGNSGGPLLNMDGEVIGINTAIVPYAQGLGFAIPVNMAKQIMDDLVTYGKVKRGWLGIAVQNLTEEFAEAYGVEAEKGVIVGDVFENSAASRAGLLRGDVIVEAQGKPVTDVQGFVSLVRSQTPGSELKLKVLRGGKTTLITAKLDEIPESEGGVASSSGKRSSSDVFKKAGLTLSKLTSDLRRRYGTEREKGLVVTEVEEGSPAQSAGLREGDLILEVNGKKIESDYPEGTPGEGKSVVLLVEREGRTFFVSLKMK